MALILVRFDILILHMFSYPERLDCCLDFIFLLATYIPIEDMLRTQLHRDILLSEAALPCVRALLFLLVSRVLSEGGTRWLSPEDDDPLWMRIDNGGLMHFLLSPNVNVRLAAIRCFH